MTRSRSVDELLEESRARLERMTPEQARAARDEGALLVDTRSKDEQREAGLIPGALHYPFSVVLWRLDELPRDTRVILICRHGHSSSIAASLLHDLGFHAATDVIDGVEGWRAAGLPLDPID